MGGLPVADARIRQGRGVERLPAAAIFLWYGISARAGQVVIKTRVGNIRASEDDARLIEQLSREVPRDKLFLLPFFSDHLLFDPGRNPTRYSYLQPGMMSDSDESAALAELIARPPDRVLYQHITEAQILNIRPGANPARLRLSKK